MSTHSTLSATSGRPTTLLPALRRVSGIKRTPTPVICSALTSNQELVRGDENGLLAAVGDPVSLADAMARCLTDEGLRARLAEAGSRSVLEFTDTRMAEQYMDLYRRLMGKGTE